MATHTIFVSHSHADNDVCDRYFAALQAAGFDIWYDRSNLQTGHSLSGEIERQLKQRTAFIVMLSEASVNSYWVRLEVDAYRALAAQDRSRLLLPVCVGQCEVPLLLQGLKYIDAWNMPFDEAMDHIVSALNGTARTITAAPPPPTAPKPKPAPTTPPPPPIRADVTCRGHISTVHRVAWSPDGSRLASIGEEALAYVWDPTTGRVICAFRGHPQGSSGRGISWSPDGTQLVSFSRADTAARIWDAANGKQVRAYSGHSSLLKSIQIRAVAWCPDGQRIATGATDGSVHVWDATTGKTLRTIQEGSEIGSVAWSPDGARLAVRATKARVINVWDVGKGQIVVSRPLEPIAPETSYSTKLAFSPDGSRIASEEPGVAVWNAATGETINPMVWLGRDFSWSPDGKYIGCADGESGVYVQPVEARAPGCHFTGHVKATAVAWSPDGSRIASGGGPKEYEWFAHKLVDHTDESTVLIWRPKL